MDLKYFLPFFPRMDPFWNIEILRHEILRHDVLNYVNDHVIITRHCVIITGNDNYVIITDRSCWLCHVIDHLSSLGMICYHHRSCSSLADWSSLTYPSPTLNPHLSLTQPSLSHTQPSLSLTQSSPIPHPTLNPHPTLTYPSHHSFFLWVNTPKIK